MIAAATARVPREAVLVGNKLCVFLFSLGAADGELMDRRRYFAIAYMSDGEIGYKRQTHTDKDIHSYIGLDM